MQDTIQDLGPAGQASQDYWNSRVRAVSQTLARSEMMVADELDAYRSRHLSAFLVHARNNVSLYRDRLDFDVGSPREIRDAWSKIPILTRAHAVKFNKELMCDKLPADAQLSVVKRTSGSTGTPLRYRSTAMSDIWSCALTERMFRWWRVDGRKSFAQIVYQPLATARDHPEGIETQGWHTARPNGLKYTRAHIFDLQSHVSWLAVRQPSYLFTYAMMIKGLAALAKRRKVTLPVELVFSVGEILDAETRDMCRSAFGTEIADTYGTLECGHIAAQCPDCREYHLSADASIIEILSLDGTPTKPGEVGRVIVTPLRNPAMPLLRYEPGDFAEMGSYSPTCSRKLPTIRRILGRSRNLFRFRDGSQVWPDIGSAQFENYISLKQFQIVQTDLDHIEFRYVPDDPSRPVDVSGLVEYVRRSIGQPLEVGIQRLEAIERSPGGKFESFISLVPSE